MVRPFGLRTVWLELRRHFTGRIEVGSVSVIFRDAIADYREMRAEFELSRHASFERAHRELCGELLNARGRAKKIDPYSLFMGSRVRASAYASEELKVWWEVNGRPTVKSFEAQWATGRPAVGGSDAWRADAA